MPAGAPLAPRGRPARLARLGSLPEGEVQRVPLSLIHLDAGTRLEFVDLFVGELAVVLELADLEKDIIPRDVGVAVVDNPLDQRDHLRNIFGAERFVGRRLDTKR